MGALRRPEGVSMTTGERTFDVWQVAPEMAVVIDKRMYPQKQPGVSDRNMG